MLKHLPDRLFLYPNETRKDDLMKKLSLHIPLERKPEQFPAAEAVVEKVVSLSGAQFSRLRNHPLDDHEEIPNTKAILSGNSQSKKKRNGGHRRQRSRE